jgi:hypothetical protein
MSSMVLNDRGVRFQCRSEDADEIEAKEKEEDKKMSRTRGGEEEE